MRRSLPRAQVAWARLVAGDISNPLVARNFLIGFASTTALYALFGARFVLVSRSAGGTLVWDMPHWPGALGGPLAALSNAVHPVLLAVPFGLMFLIVLPFSLLKSASARPVASGLGFAMALGFALLSQGVSISAAAYGAVLGVVGLTTGLVGLIGATSWLVVSVLAPVSLDPELWWATSSWLPLLLVLVLVLGAMRNVSRSPSS
jgi:hypothetical protein